MINEFDNDGDGIIDFEEFQELMRRGTNLHGMYDNKGEGGACGMEDPAVRARRLEAARVRLEDSRARIEASKAPYVRTPRPPLVCHVGLHY